MTARDKLNLTIESNRKELNTIKKMGVYSTLAVFMVLIVSYLNVYFHNDYLFFIQLTLSLVFMIPFIIGYRASNARNKLVCPKCNKDLDYLFTSKDYNPKGDYTAFPVNISKCPYCSLKLDDEY